MLFDYELSRIFLKQSCFYRDCKTSSCNSYQAFLTIVEHRLVIHIKFFQQSSDENETRNLREVKSKQYIFKFFFHFYSIYRSYVCFDVEDSFS